MLLYTSMLLVYCLGNFLLVRPVDQQRRQLEVTFYFRWCIMGSGVGLIARDSRLAMTVVVESWVIHYSLDLMLLTGNFYCLDFKCLLFEEHFLFLSACLGVSKYLNLHLKLHFSAICNKQNYKIFYPLGWIIMTIQVTLKQVNFEKLIWTLLMWHKELIEEIREP